MHPGLRSSATVDNVMNQDNDRVRIDKWLWAARFFKTRALAQAAVVAGKVRLHGERSKPGKEVKVGDALAIRIGEFAWDVVVQALSERRGPTDEARRLYAESADSIALRAAQIADRKAQGNLVGERKGRPTKRERRQIIRFREGG